jgi:zinc protease
MSNARLCDESVSSDWRLRLTATLHSNCGNLSFQRVTRFTVRSYRDLVAADLKDVQSFYDQYYGPTNATLALVGDFNKKEALDLINKYFATMPKTAKVTTPTLPKVAIGKEEIIRVDEKLGKLPLIRIQYITPGYLAPGDAEMDLLSHILTGGANGRLTKALTRDKQIANSVSATQQSFGQTSVFTIDVVLNPSVSEADAIKEVDRILTELANTPITATEIERAKNSILTGQLFGLQSLGGYSGRAELLQTYNHFALRPDYLKDDILRYSNVDATALTNAAKKYLPVGKARKILIAKPVFVSVAKKGN